MGQKINPKGFRVAVTKDWDSKWFSRKYSFGDWLREDLAIREYVKKEFKSAAISRVLIHRASNRMIVEVYSARPGVLSSRKGEFTRLQEGVNKIIEGKEIRFEVKEVKRAEIDAQLVAEGVAAQLERRIGFRRAMKKCIQTAMETGALGIKVKVSGRLGGAELARTEQYKEGKVPLHTIRANIDYGFTEAETTAGKIGVKVWICRPDEAEKEG